MPESVANPASTSMPESTVLASVHHSVPHDSATRHVTGAAPYIDDLPEPRGTLHLALGLAPIARGRLIALDLAAVRAKKGVVAVFTAADIPGRNDVSPALGDEPMMAVLLGAGLTWLLHSSVAMVLFIMALTGAHVIALPLGLTLLLGANIGAGLIPLGLGWREPQSARRILIGNFLFRVAGALVALAFLSTLTGIVLPEGQSPERAIASAHMLFNIALACVFLPFIEQIARLLERYLPDDPAHDASSSRPLHLDEALLDQPALALGAASREVMRLAERVEAMLSDTIHTFSDNDDKRRMAIRKLDDEVDALQEAIKLYLTRLTRQPLSEADARRAFDLILFTTNLEHVGDIIDRNLMELAAKKIKHQ